LSPSTWACLACFFLCPRFLILICNHCWGVCVWSAKVCMWPLKAEPFSAMKVEGHWPKLVGNMFFFIFFVAKKNEEHRHFLFYISLPPRTKKKRHNGWHHPPPWNRFWKQAFPGLALWKVKSYWSTTWHRMRVPLRRRRWPKWTVCQQTSLSTLRWPWISCWTCRTRATSLATHSVTTRPFSSMHWCRWKTSCWRIVFFGIVGLFLFLIEHREKQIHIHTYIHAYVHTCIKSSQHRYIYAYICIHTIHLSFHPIIHLYYPGDSVS
jgi:hypothetical protein